MVQPAPAQKSEGRDPVVRYPVSTDGLGTGSGGISFEEFAYTYALENKMVQPKGMLCTTAFG